MNIEVTDLKIDDLKPKMETLGNFANIQVTPSLTIQVKADGEFTKLSYNRYGFTPTVKAYTLNQWGKLRTDFPALDEFTLAMNASNVKSAEFLCELYAKEEGRPLMLPQFIHYVKSKNFSDHLKVHIGIWDILSIDDKPDSRSPLEKFQNGDAWFKGCEHVAVLPYIQPKTMKEIEDFWRTNVLDLHYEGIVIRDNGSILKFKPLRDLDAVIMGINKRSNSGKGNLFAQHQVTSVHLALMLPDNRFVEVGNCAIGDHQLRSAMWRLMQYKVNEDDQTVYVKPKVIVKVEYRDLFRSKNRVYEYDEKGYRSTWTMNLVKLRNPTLTEFRRDKKVTPQDLRLEQIPQGYIVKEE